MRLLQQQIRLTRMRNFELRKAAAEAERHRMKKRQGEAKDEPVRKKMEAKVKKVKSATHVPQQRQESKEDLKPPPGHVVSRAGGFAEKCKHPGCDQEVEAGCPECLVSLCIQHLRGDYQLRDAKINKHLVSGGFTASRCHEHSPLHPCRCWTCIGIPADVYKKPRRLQGKTMPYLDIQNAPT